MKVENNFGVSFKASEMTNGTKSNISFTGEPPYLSAVPSSETLKAYNLVKLGAGKGIENAVITPDQDASKLVYGFRAPDPNTSMIKIVYSLENDDKQRETFSSQKNHKTGEFKIAIPVLNRKDNSIVNNLKINSVEYFDESNFKIDEQKPENMSVNPKNIMTVKEVRTTIIGDDVSNEDFDSISEGVSLGKLVEMEYEDIVRYKEKEPIIAILSDNDMSTLLMEIPAGTFTLPMNVKGLIASPKYYKQGSMLTDCLGHAVSRLRGRKTFALVAKPTMDAIKGNYLNNPENPYMKLELDMDNMKVSGLQELPKADDSKVKVPEFRLVNRLLIPEDKDFAADTVGLKAFNLGKLKQLQQTGGFKVPNFFVVPAGVWNEVKNSEENADTYGRSTSDVEKIGGYHFCVKKADGSDNPINELKGIRRLITDDIIIPKDIRTQLKEMTEEIFDIPEMRKNNGCLIARSSFNGEDSATVATMGWYDSFPGIRTYENLFRGIKEVEASKWSDLAYWGRRNHGIDHGKIQGNVIVQEVVPVDYTFTLYTADPRKNNKNKMVAQFSPGVYPGFPNTPYIFEYDKTTHDITRKTMAQKKRTKPIDKMIMDDFANLKYDIVDYSKDPLNMSKKDYSPVMEKVFKVAQFIENSFDNKYQDIEGGIIFKRNEKTGELEPEIHIWQTRDAHLIKR